MRKLGATLMVGFLPDFHSISVPSALCSMGSPSSSKMKYVFVCTHSKLLIRLSLAAEQPCNVYWVQCLPEW